MALVNFLCHKFLFSSVKTLNSYDPKIFMSVLLVNPLHIRKKTVLDHSEAKIKTLKILQKFKNSGTQRAADPANLERGEARYSFL